MKNSLALPAVDLTELADAIAERTVARLHDAAPIQGNSDEPLLLTIEQAAKKLGRSVPATEHLVRSGKLIPVRIDRRLQIDYRDILSLIQKSKEPAPEARDATQT
jgi:hypothetical protein